MPNETQETQNSTPPPDISMDAAVSLELPSAESSPEPSVAVTPAAAAETSSSDTSAAKPATPSSERSADDKMMDFMLGVTNEDPTASVKPVDGEEPIVTPVVSTQQPVVPVQPPSAKLSATRDYSGLNSDETVLFKGMSNQAYATIRPIYDQHKKVSSRETELTRREEAVKTATPKGVYDDEQAFVLTPQYREAAGATQMFKIESDYWAAQLAKIEAGEDWKELMRDSSTGRYFEGDKALPATPSHKSEVLRKFTLATQQHGIHSQRVRDVQDTHVDNRQRLIQGIRDYEKKFFPTFEDAKNPYQAVVNQVLDAIPPEFRDHPLASPLAKAMATVKVLHNNVQTLSRVQAVKQQAASDKSRAGPTMSQTNTAVNGTRALRSDEVSPENILSFMGMDK